MTDRLTRWQWARQHSEGNWLREIIVLLVGAGLYLGVSKGYGSDEAAASALGAAIAGCGAVIMVRLVEFAWHFLSSDVSQDRRELSVLRKQVALATRPLDLDVRVDGVGEGSPYGMPQTGGVLSISRMRLTNRSRDRMSLSFSVAAAFPENRGGEIRLTDHWVPEPGRQPEAASVAPLLRGPLALEPQHTEIGSMIFTVHPGIKRLLSQADTFLLQITDHVSGNTLSQPIPTREGLG
jgi:hypothetical protein